MFHHQLFGSTVSCIFYLAHASIVSHTSASTIHPTFASTIHSTSSSPFSRSALKCNGLSLGLLDTIDLDSLIPYVDSSEFNYVDRLLNASTSTLSVPIKIGKR